MRKRSKDKQTVRKKDQKERCRRRKSSCNFEASKLGKNNVTDLWAFASHQHRRNRLHRRVSSPLPLYSPHSPSIISQNGPRHACSFSPRIRNQRTTPQPTSNIRRPLPKCQNHQRRLRQRRHPEKVRIAGRHSCP